MAGKGGTELPTLTTREREVLVKLCRTPSADAPFAGPATVREVADALCVSEAAVKQHLLRLYDKFGIWPDAGQSRRVLLANEAMRRGALAIPAGLEPDGLAMGRQALSQHDWELAFGQFSRADHDGILSARDLEGLGEAAMWTLRHDESVSARTRAHAAYLEEGDRRGAARAALGLAANAFSRLKLAVASGWLATATSIAAEEGDCPEAGIAEALSGLIHALTGQPELALRKARGAQDLGRQLGDPNSLALGLVIEGLVLIQSDARSDGYARLDEAMASAASGALAPMVTAIVYCRMISTCMDVFDFTRAQEWTDEIGRLERTTAQLGFPGDCRTHRAALHLMTGRWSEGETEAARVCTEGALELSHVISAQTTIGEVRLRQGDLVGAADAFAKVVELGGLPEPGSSLLMLANGAPQEAAAAIRATLSGTSDETLRARLLPASVEIALASGDLDEARIGAAELGTIAATLKTPALRAAAAHAEGAVALARADALRAVRSLRIAVADWQSVNAPYEAGRARVLLGRALRALGDRAGANRELRSAASIFDSLGAARDVAEVKRHQAE